MPEDETKWHMEAVLIGQCTPEEGSREELVQGMHPTQSTEEGLQRGRLTPLCEAQPFLPLDHCIFFIRHFFN